MLKDTLYESTIEDLEDEVKYWKKIILEEYGEDFSVRYCASLLRDTKEELKNARTRAAST